tara:strand:- start:276 stop:905 length:630 start_codon:yes stop_codon:yes gene_type:complete
MEITMGSINYTFYNKDLPKHLNFSDCIAIDTETMGLDPNRDRLCLVQISSGDGHAHLVQIQSQNTYPNLINLLKDNRKKKIFHFARFDLAMLYKNLNVECSNIYCTKIASKLARTYTDKHGLKELCKELLNIEISKQKQSSDWGNKNLSEDQLKYAASDVLYLHDIMKKLNEVLIRENRIKIAEKCFDFLTTRVYLDLHGWRESDIFTH